eukprot:19446-Pelagomonas_calceolata.AAC.1
MDKRVTFMSYKPVSNSEPWQTSCPGEADWVMLEKEGKQSYLTDRCTPAYILKTFTAGPPQK